jgi:hypothetical protein
MFEIVTVAVGGVADAGVATSPRPATLIAKTATTATHHVGYDASTHEAFGSVRNDHRTTQKRKPEATCDVQICRSNASELT